eukprot:1561617-Amphidinium_carterae.1
MILECSTPITKPPPPVSQLCFKMVSSTAQDGERFDGVLLNIARQAGSIDNILDAFFGFLQRMCACMPKVT